MLRPITLTDQIYQELKRRVLRCELKPGERLIEKSLCDQLGVSRGSLRETLSRLSHERLITQIPNRGFHVTSLTVEDFRRICEVRRAVEPDVAALAAERATPERIQALRKHATLTEDPFGEEEPHVRCIRFNSEFHLGIARCVDNHFLEEIVASALDKDQQPLFYGIDLETCTDATAITREHHAILDAIEAGNAKQAHDLMVRHIEEKEARILAAWQSNPSIHC